MKLICMALLSTLLLVACSLNRPDEAIIINDNSTVIDVRTEQEYKEGHLKNAVNIPYDIITDKIKAHVPDKKETIIVYCRSGRRSGIAKKNLDAMGYKDVINAGGYKKLKQQEQEKQTK